MQETKALVSLRTGTDSPEPLLLDKVILSIKILDASPCTLTVIICRTVRVNFLQIMKYWILS